MTPKAGRVRARLKRLWDPRAAKIARGLMAAPARRRLFLEFLHFAVDPLIVGLYFRII